MSWKQELFRICYRLGWQIYIYTHRMEKGNYLTTWYTWLKRLKKNRFCSPDVPAYRWRLRSRPETTGTSWWENLHWIQMDSRKGHALWSFNRRKKTPRNSLKETSRKPKGCSRLSIPNSRHNVQPDDAWTCLDGPLGFRKTSVRSWVDLPKIYQATSNHVCTLQVPSFMGWIHLR